MVAEPGFMQVSVRSAQCDMPTRQCTHYNGQFALPSLAFKSCEV